MSPETIFFCGFLVGLPMGALISMLAWGSSKQQFDKGWGEMISKGIEQAKNEKNGH